MDTKKPFLLNLFRKWNTKNLFFWWLKEKIKSVAFTNIPIKENSFSQVDSREWSIEEKEVEPLLYTEDNQRVRVNRWRMHKT